MAHDMEWTDEKSKRLWDHYAKTLRPEEYYSNHTGPHALQALSKWVDFKNATILDFGCGPGYLLGHLLRLSPKKVFGLDFSRDSVDKANQQFESHPRYGGSTAIQTLPSPLASDSFDVVVCFEVVEHLLDHELNGTLKEIYRLLKAGGRLVITTPNEEILEKEKIMCPNCEARYHRWQHVRSWSKELLSSTLQEHGFQIVTIQATLFQSRKQLMTTTAKNAVKRLIGKPTFELRPHLFAIAEKRG